MIESRADSIRKTHIKRIIVMGLFGYLNYDISSFEDDESDSELMILYGENGSGKTTILNLLFHLLSTESGGGHKTYLSQTPFRVLEVLFSDTSRIFVKKDQDKLVGGFIIGGSNDLGHEHAFVFKLGSDGRMKADDNPITETNQFIADLGVSLYFVPDDRRVQSESTDVRRKGSYSRLVRNNFTQTYTASSDVQLALMNELGVRALSNEASASESHHLQIRPVLEELSGWLRGQVIQGSNLGDQDASSIYYRVMEDLKLVEGPSEKLQLSAAKDFTKRLKTLDEKIMDYSAFGLMPRFDADRFISSFEDAKAGSQITIRGILNPYLDGLEARLNALREVYDLVNTYTSMLNLFFSGKRVDVSVGRGITITAASGEAIEPNLLSSGEKQLLLLFSNTLLARQKTTIFIIDEPELSLNVKWQRMLVGALLQCSRGGGIQYILASHSLELISQYRSKSMRLTSLNS